jgi:mannitol/fructose-specific phosphotransferase system IIA component (Ntr-type)
MQKTDVRSRMNLKEAFSPQAVKLHLTSTAKDAAIDELLDVLDAAGLLPDRDSARQSVLEREAKMSTGMQHGIAIPHAKCAAVNRVVAAVGIQQEGIDFDAFDGQPSSIFILTLSPVHRTGPYVQFLAEISRVLNEEPVRQRLLAANTADEVVAILTE